MMIGLRGVKGWLAAIAAAAALAVKPAHAHPLFRKINWKLSWDSARPAASVRAPDQPG